MRHHHVIEDDRRWELNGTGRDRLAHLMKGVPFHVRRDLLRARGFSCWEAVVPERRESIAAGIADDWRSGRLHRNRVAA